jgi:broad specificity phosphatase PhoE/ribonuclease HI
VSGRRLLVEADGGSRGNPGPAGYGALVRDAATGELLDEVAEAIGTATNNVAEYRGLIAGLRAAARIDPSAQVEVRMDSKLVVEQMSGRWSIKHEDMRRLALAARDAQPTGMIRYQWIPRAQNAHADRLANAAMDAAAGKPPRRSGAPQAAVAAASVAPEPTVSERVPGGADLGEPTTLVLLRHGRTRLTEQRRFSGGDGEDPELTGTGVDEARRAGAAVGTLGTAGSWIPGTGPVTAVVSSPRRRARQTAEAVTAATGVQCGLDDDWTEIGFGEWDGLTFAEIAKRSPAELGRWQGSASFSPPGGESLDDLAARVRTARERVVAANPRGVVVVATHTTPVRAVVRDVLGAAPESLWRIQVATCSLTAVRFWADGQCDVLAVNATGHLR